MKAIATTLLDWARRVAAMLRKTPEVDISAEVIALALRVQGRR